MDKDTLVAVGEFLEWWINDADDDMSLRDMVKTFKRGEMLKRS